MKDTLKTQKTDDWPEITWILGEVIDTNYEKLMVIREAAGSDAEGNNYSGLAYFFAEKFEQMEGIEKL